MNEGKNLFRLHMVNVLLKRLESASIIIQGFEIRHVHHLLM